MKWCSTDHRTSKPVSAARRASAISSSQTCGQVGHQLQVVGAEGVVVEVVLDRPQDVEAGVGGDAGERDFLVPGLGV